MAISKIIYKSSPNATPETWMDATPATAAATDIIAPKTAMLADGLLTVGTGSGGGASNVVTGTFKGTTTGTALEVNVPYTGNGYPIAVIIQPSEGSYNSEDGAFYTLLQRYAISLYFSSKTRVTTNPTYTGSGADNAAASYRIYKSSASNATAYNTAASTGSSNTVYLYNDSDATASGSSGANVVRFKTSKKMSVYIASTSFGFAANIEYTYVIVYSS